MRSSIFAFSHQRLRIGWLEVFSARWLHIDESTAAASIAVAETS